MLDARIFGDELKRRGFDFYSGVPCSFLKALINYSINECEFMMAANEGDAAALCAGAYLGGRKPVFLCQNSGLANAVSPLTSLNHIFKIPLLGFVSLRGEPGLSDEPQHELMGTITEKMLEIMKIEWEYLSRDPDSAAAQLDAAEKLFGEGRPFFFVVKKDTFEKLALEKRMPKKGGAVLVKNKSANDSMPARLAALEKISSLKTPETVIIAATGKTGRELHDIDDSPNNFYMVGSMGCVGSLGLGLAHARPDRKIIAIDGDAALLMRMGSMATSGFYSPPNFLHILLDNNCHDSTGGQATVSDNVDFISVAAACGYNRSIYLGGIEQLEYELKKWLEKPQLTFMYLKIKKGSAAEPGRPKVKPHEVCQRLKKFLG